MASQRMKVKRALPVLRALRRTVNDVSSLIREKGGASCTQGCDHCCYQIVWLSLSEALHILEHVSSSWYEDNREWVERGWKLWLEEGITPYDWMAQRIGCPFLEEHQCSIYSVRPTECAMYMVVTPAEECAKPGWHSGVLHTDTMDQLRTEGILISIQVTGVPGVFPMPVAFSLARTWLEGGREAVLERMWAAGMPQDPEAFGDYLRNMGRNADERI